MEKNNITTESEVDTNVEGVNFNSVKSVLSPDQQLNEAEVKDLTNFTTAMINRMRGSVANDEKYQVAA